MKTIMLTFLLCLPMLVLSENLVFSPSGDKILIGEERVKVTVVFNTSKYHLDECSQTKAPNGFFVVEREDNKKLMFFCGATRKRGDTFEILVEKGI